MDLISLLIVILVIAFAIWRFARYVSPALPPPVGSIALAIFALILIVVLLQVTGIVDLNAIRIGR